MAMVASVVPAFVVEPFGTVLSRADARTEVRAVYGGFAVGLAVLLELAVVDLPGFRAGAV